MKISDLKSKPPKILLYGQPRTGKTAFCLTLGSRLHVVDCDDGLETGQKMEDEWTSTRREVDFQTFINPDPNVYTAFARAKAHIFDIVSQVFKKTCPFNALLIDSLTTLAENCIVEVMTNSGKGAADLRTVRMWGLAILEMEQLFSTLRTLPIPVILTGHTRVNTIDDVDKIGLDIYGKNLPNKIMGTFGELWYAKVINLPGGKTKRVLQTDHTAAINCGSRAGLPNNTDMSLGLEKVLSLIGYIFPS